MKRLTKTEIVKLRAGAIELSENDNHYWFSCNIVECHGGRSLRKRYARGVGVLGMDTGSGGYSAEILAGTIPPREEQQLARSLAVLMFIEANR